MSDVIRRLVTVLGFDAEDDKAKKYDKALADIKKTALGAAAAVSAVAGAVALSVKTYADNADAAIKLGRAIGFSADELLSLEYAAQRAGAGASGLTSAIQTYSQGLSQASIGQGQAREAFARLGVDIRNTNGQVKSASALFPQIADAITKLGSRAEQIALTEQIFGGDGKRFLLLLEQGSGGIRGLQREFKRLGGGLQGSTKDVERFQDSWLDFKTIIGGVKNTVGAEVLPILNDLLRQFRRWYDANGALIRQNIARYIQNIRDFLTPIIDVGARVIDTLKAIVDRFGGVDAVVRVLAISFGLLSLGRLAKSLLTVATSAATLKKALIFTGIAALALALEDIYVWMQGGNSLIGKYTISFKEFKKVWQNVVDAFNSGQGVLDTIKKTFESIAKAWLGVSGILLNNLFGFGGEMSAEDRSRALNNSVVGASSSRSVSVNSTVNLQLPAGTTEEQAAVIRKTAREEYRKESDRQLRAALLQAGGAA